jgi:chromosomal replication initiation ATPase DnaA
MNDDIIQAYIDNITQHFGVSQKFILSEGRKLKKTTPRNMLYYLCLQRGIPIVFIQNFLKKNNFYMHHASILQGVQRIGVHIENNPDYARVFNKLKLINVNV